MLLFEKSVFFLEVIANVPNIGVVPLLPTNNAFCHVNQAVVAWGRLYLRKDVEAQFGSNIELPHFQCVPMLFRDLPQHSCRAAQTFM